MKKDALIEAKFLANDLVNRWYVEDRIELLGEDYREEYEKKFEGSLADEEAVYAWLKSKVKDDEWPAIRAAFIGEDEKYMGSFEEMADRAEKMVAREKMRLSS